ncbi:unnamed protein product [Gadus morhua 'NCC']
MPPPTLPGPRGPHHLASGPLCPRSPGVACDRDPAAGPPLCVSHAPIGPARLAVFPKRAPSRLSAFPPPDLLCLDPAPQTSSVWIQPPQLRLFSLRTSPSVQLSRRVLSTEPSSQRETTPNN